ncbi:MAG TPA: protein rep [Candidatus Absconditabacterales bacterium]|nr:protein rep [Candidatus Absconditabacterales bacterium]HMY80571.1 protein rep [Candidatus Absconditabacterales bacterium]HNG96778.1 protein rep [Candidatus Absconditabacterales bacterium]
MENISAIVQPAPAQKKVFYATMAKFTKSQELKAKIIPYLLEHYPQVLRNPNRKQRMRECCNMVAFRRYLDTGNIQLVSSNFCKYDRICIACATKRAMRMIKKFSQGIQEHSLYNKKRYYIVLTISHKEGDALSELMDRLMLYKDKLARAYRNSKRDNHKSKSFFAQFDGMVMSIEIDHKGKNGRHPHINILACSDNDIVTESKFARGNTNQQLLDEWKEITNGTSYIHNIRYIEVKKDHFSRSGIGEVFKYAIKFSDLSMEQLAEVMANQHKHKYRFFATYGIFRGWELGEGVTYDGDWSEGVFLYDEGEKKYNIQNAF